MTFGTTLIYIYIYVTANNIVNTKSLVMETKQCLLLIFAQIPRIEWVLNILSVLYAVLIYPACKACAPQYIVIWGLSD